MIGSMPRLGRDSILLAPGFVIPGVISLVLIPLLFGSLGASQYGVLALILAVANGVPMLTTSWLEAVLVRFSHHGEFETPRWVVGASLAASALIGAFVAVLFIPTPDVPVIVITAVFTAAVGAYLLVVARLQSLMRFGAISRGATVRSILGGVLAVALGGASGTASLAAVGLVIGFAAGTLLMVIDERRAGRPVGASAVADGSSGDQGRTGRRELASYGAGSLAVAASLYVLSVGDRFVLSAVRPLSEVGSMPRPMGSSTCSFGWCRRSCSWPSVHRSSDRGTAEIAVLSCPSRARSVCPRMAARSAIDRTARRREHDGPAAYRPGVGRPDHSRSGGIRGGQRLRHPLRGSEKHQLRLGVTWHSPPHSISS